MIKICRICNLPKEHYDSVPTGCRDCYKARVTENRRNNLEAYRAYDRNRSKTDARKEQYADKQRNKRKSEGPLYEAAHRAVKNAIKSGILIRPTVCSKCQIPCKPDGHHDDHLKPLEVLWLCKVCHAQRHVELSKL